MNTDAFGRIWDLSTDELCPTCGQPDNCGDCSHAPLSDEDYALLNTITHKGEAVSTPFEGLNDIVAMQKIQAIMNGTEWSADTLEAIAEVVRQTGRVIASPDDTGPRCPTCGTDDFDFLVNDDAVCKNGHRWTVAVEESDTFETFVDETPKRMCRVRDLKAGDVLLDGDTERPVATATYTPAGGGKVRVLFTDKTSRTYAAAAGVVVKS